MGFDEDRSQVRTAAGPRIMASLRNLVITNLRRIGGAMRPTVANRALGLAPSRRAQVRPSRASMAVALASGSRPVMVICRSARS